MAYTLTDGAVIGVLIVAMMMVVLLCSGRRR